MTFLNHRTLYFFILVFGMSGYELTAALTQVLGVVSTPYSMAFRAVVAFAAASVLLTGAQSYLKQRSWLVIGFVIFWAMYSLRIFYDSFYPHYSMMYAWWYYYSWVIGACFLPMIAMATWSPTSEESVKAARWLLIFLGCAALLAAILGTASPELGKHSVNAFHGRFHLESLNPISMGHLGASVFLLSFWHISQGVVRRSVVGYAVMGLLIALGIGLLVAANSKGPMLAVMVCLVFMMVFSSGRKGLATFWVLVATAVLFMPLAYIAQNHFGIRTYSRMFEESVITGGSTPERLQRLASGWADFLASPFIGQRIEESQFGGYPHNIILEALMATGVFGGLLLAVLLLVMVFKAIKVYRTMPVYGWVAVLFIQHLVGSQVSGAVYTVNYLWLMAGVLMGLSFQSNPSILKPLAEPRNVKGVAG